MRTPTNQQTSIASRKRRTTMKTSNSTRHSTTAKLILGVLFATCVFTAAANAQPSFEGKFTLPYEVQWNHAVLPAGEYSIEVDAKGMPAVLRIDQHRQVGPHKRADPCRSREGRRPPDGHDSWKRAQSSFRELACRSASPWFSIHSPRRNVKCSPRQARLTPSR